MATKKGTEVAKADNNMPAFLKTHMGDTRGSEEVGADDLVIPRIELVQALSACRKRTDPTFIDGAVEGMLYNNVTRELYGDEVNVVPIYFRKEWLLWRDQDLGGGFGGAYPDEASAEKALSEQEKPEEWEVIDTNVHFVLLLKEDGNIEEAVISMAKTKAKVSRAWNTLVRLNGGPRFSRVYTVRGVPDQNAAGQDFHNLQVINRGFVTEEQFKHAEAVYDLITAGKVDINRDYDDTSAAEDSDI